jgi:hypothetical protein
MQETLNVRALENMLNWIAAFSVIACLLAGAAIARIGKTHREIKEIKQHLLGLSRALASQPSSAVPNARSESAGH